MEESIPRPLLLRRLPSGARTALLWCAAAAFALLLSRTLPSDTHPVFLPEHRHLHTDPLLLASLCVLVAAPLGVARSRPVPVLGVLLAATATAALFGERTWPFVLPIDLLVGYVAATRGRRTALSALVLALLVAGSELFVSGSPIGDEAWNTTPYVLTMLLAWLLGTTIRQRREYAEALRAQVALQAVTAERLRIARELHDMVAHSIGIIAIQAGAGSRIIETRPDDAGEALRTIETTSREVLAGLRRMLGTLRQAEPAPTGSTAENGGGMAASGAGTAGLRVGVGSGAEQPSAPGLADVDRLAESLAGAGVKVEVRWRGRRRRLPPEIDLSAFRIIQESMTNVVRHAQASTCQVSVDYGDSDVSIEIVDDGRGGRAAAAGASPGSGFGISGMRERADLLHGVLSAGPLDGGGFRVAARLPV